MEQFDQLVLNSISAKALKSYLTTKIAEAIDELAAKKNSPKKKAQTKKPENRIPLDLINKNFVSKFGLKGYKDGVLNSLICSLVENNYFENGKLKRGKHDELVLLDIEKEILARIDENSSLNIDVLDVKVLANRLRTNADRFEFKGHTYYLEQNKTEDIINQLIKNSAISMDMKNTIKDTFYMISDELLDVFKNRLFKCPQVKDNIISRARLYEYFIKATKPDDSKIYVILKDDNIAKILNIETIVIDHFIYTKHSLLVSSISNQIDKYSKKFNDQFYSSISEYIKDNEKINLSKVIEYLTISTVKIENTVE
ncbi:putative DNA-binding virion core protein [Fowlpox virus]|uniref:Telomere-binding protein I1 homolog n=2 Tax=Fowlpox virus TaxID=10261 RepID=I1_FOWPN|nr:putative DNA-binding virion core protein [Fowlpox virus]Q9J5C9.1 RecName: Full=Telomere-binding protein I1 homolog; AltName: Full=Protein FPV90 [Fowlpox virus strain NVSL]UNS14288.1 ALPV-124 [Albatrosspox virus]WPD90937.1 I1-like virion protein [Avipoxvirus sp.]CAE52632.1 DNA-binding core protein I1L orthologue [Fowlpox virus isolate HP-438/Munich]AAF44434.1 ORF FPV090 Virion protein [Fowlpox virus]AXY04532.1 putative DNA-binding virion core protein [Fowlpox virus]